jgi:hypothetical protein
MLEELRQAEAGAPERIEVRHTLTRHACLCVQSDDTRVKPKAQSYTAVSLNRSGFSDQHVTPSRLYGLCSLCLCHVDLPGFSY